MRGEEGVSQGGEHCWDRVWNAGLSVEAGVCWKMTGKEVDRTVLLGSHKSGRGRQLRAGRLWA